jgi:hypothetical protein
MTNIGILWHPGDDGQIPCGEAAARASLYRSGDADSGGNDENAFGPSCTFNSANSIDGATTKQITINNTDLFR